MHIIHHPESADVTMNNWKATEAWTDFPEEKERLKTLLKSAEMDNNCVMEQNSCSLQSKHNANNIMPKRHVS